MIATVQTDLQKKINNLCKKYRIELEADESALMGRELEMILSKLSCYSLRFRLLQLT